MVDSPLCQIEPDYLAEGKTPYANIRGAYSYSAKRFADARGDFVNLELGMPAVEAGTAVSAKYVVRGFHCSPYPKIVGCLNGAMFDVLVDLRPKSPTFLKHECITLRAVGMDREVTAEKRNGFMSAGDCADAGNGYTEGKPDAPTYIYVPSGVAHGYLAMEENTLTLYMKGGCFDPDKELNFQIHDKKLGIVWPVPLEQHVISPKDEKSPTVEELIEATPALKNLVSQHKKLWYAPNKFEAYGDAEIMAVTKCLRQGWLAPGPQMAEFERKVAKYFGKQYGIMVNSGSSANLMGLAALELPRGSEVVTPACTFSTVIAPIEQLGLVPVFVDVELRSYVPSEKDILAAITPKTSCLMIPNLVGSKVDWKFLRHEITKMGRSDIILFEDSCDCMTYTKESDVSAISFYASHIITAGGQGGVFMCNDENLLKRCFMYRDWGRVGNNSECMEERFKESVDGIPYDGKFLYGVKGYNFKSVEMCAAFGLEQFKKLDKFTRIRRRNIKRFYTNIEKFGPNSRYILPRADYESMDWLAFPVQHPNRQGVINYLEKNDVQIRVTFAGNVTRHPAYRHYFKEYKNADTIMSNGFLLGAHHGVTESEVDIICKYLQEFDEIDNQKSTVGG